MGVNLFLKVAETRFKEQKMKIAEVTSGLAGKKSSNSMLSAALEDFFKPSSGDVESENVLSDRLAAAQTPFFLIISLKNIRKKVDF